MNRTPEDRLRAALQNRADQIEPSSDGLDRIEEKLMDIRSLNRRQQWTLGLLGAAAALLIVVFGVVALTGDDDESGVVTGTTTTTTSTSTPTSTTDTTSTTQAFPPDVDPFAVAFPSPEDSRRFDAPETAARAYATDVLGFTELEVGEYREGDSRSGEVPVTDRPGRAETTILVRQMEDDHWYVLGSQTADIEVDEPTAGATVTPLFRTSGRALAFEGTVDVVVLPQGDPTPLGESFVTGSGTPPAGPFNGRVRFDAPDDDRAGVLVYRTLSAEDGHVERATSFPVRLSASACDYPGADLEGEGVIEVWLLCEPDDFGLALVHREIAGSDDVLSRARAAMVELLDGPSSGEADNGYSSVFSIGESGLLGVSVADGILTVDLDGAIGDELANSSFNIINLRDQIFYTMSQFPEISVVDVHFDGSCDDFAEWSQSDSCRLTG